MCAARAREWYDREAKERQKEHGNTAPGRTKTLPVNLPEVKKGETDARNQVGKAFGVSGKTVAEAGPYNTRKETHPMSQPEFLASLETQLSGIAYQRRDLQEFLSAVWPLAEDDPCPVRWAREFLTSGLAMMA